MPATWPLQRDDSLPTCCPEPSRHQAVAAVVERVGVREGRTGRSRRIRRARRGAMPARPSSTPSARLAKSPGAGPRDCDSRPGRPGHRSCRSRSRAGTRPRPKGSLDPSPTTAEPLARSKAERSAFGGRAIAAARLEAVDGDDAADRFRAPQRRLRPADHLDPGGEVGIQDLKSRSVARGRVVRS